MKISMQEAAINLERICDEVEDSADISPQLESLFHMSKFTLEETISRRINFLFYAQSQAEAAQAMVDKWQTRQKKFQDIIESIKDNTLQTMKTHPHIPFISELGSFKIQKNSVPSLEITDDSHLSNYYYDWTETRLDKKKLKDDLTEGKQIDGACLKYGEHLRISLKTSPKERK